MISPEEKKILSEMSKSQYGIILKRYFAEELENLSDITQTKSWEETLGKQFAVGVIKRLISFMEEKKAIEQKKNQYE